MKVLFIGAHTDDIEAGAGGTLHKMVNEGHEVVCLALSYCGDDRLIVEYKNSMNVIGVKKSETWPFDVRRMGADRQMVLNSILGLRTRFIPDIVFTHSLDDIHQDHQVVAQESLRAFKHTIIYSYELAQNSSAFRTAAFSKISAENLDAKCKALACYKSQAHRNYMKEDFIRAQARFRGMQANCDFAEVFEVVRAFI